jgi:hypothetical protein
LALAFLAFLAFLRRILINRLLERRSYNLNLRGTNTTNGFLLRSCHNRRIKIEREKARRACLLYLV